LGSITPFEFATAARIVFGPGRAEEIGRIVSELGIPDAEGHDRVFLVTGRRALRVAGVVDRLTDALTGDGWAVSTFTVSGEPTVSLIDAGLAEAKAWNPGVVVALGGGSVLDAGKAIAGLLTNGGATLDYLEGVGSGRTFERPALPLVAVPTTAGTGSEATKNAVISADDGSFKKSMRSPHLLPRVAVVDPLLTHTMPPEVTAFSGLDALTQLIEPFTSNGASALTDALAERGIRLAARSLFQAYEHPSDAEARQDMALAALFSGICLANAGLGAVHGLVAPLGAAYPVSHGAGCATLLPHVVEMNIRRLRKEAPAHPTLEKYRRIGEIFVPDSREPLEELARVLRDLVTRMCVPGLGSWGLTPEGIPGVVKKSRGSSMRFNPVVLMDDELATILEAAM